MARRPIDRFLRVEAASGILLLLAALIAIILANSPAAPAFSRLWETPLGVRLGRFVFERPLVWFINDCLMVIFFFVVGLEIRREIFCGELSEWRRATLPCAAAIGGMVAPAAAYLLLAGEPRTRSGWGVPMATDIAFALGILALLGKRVPAALRVLLLALAVIDDLGAIVVIALFYSSGVSVVGLAVAALGLALIVLMQRIGVRAKLVYVVPGVVVWAGVYAAGIHPTIAGVLVGLVTPVRAWLGREGLTLELDRVAGRVADAGTSHDVAQALQDLSFAQRETLSPAEALIETLHPWVAFGIMPLFALANAGVSLSGGGLDATTTRVAVAVAIGLVLGKPIGILVACGATLRLGVASLPKGIGLRQLVVLGVVAGIGFTMALFIAQLAFSDARTLAAAKLGVMAASGLAAVLALALGGSILPRAPTVGAAQTADEAERSTDL